MISIAAAQSAPALLTWPQLLVVAGVLGLALLLLLAIRPWSGRGTPSRRMPTDDTPGTGATTAGRSDAASTRAAQDDLEHAMLQLDLKLQRLRHLIAEADQRLERLAEAEKNSAASSRTALVEDDDPDPLQRRVCELAAEGCDSMAIARRLDEPVGKVELILALRRRVAEARSTTISNPR